MTRKPRKDYWTRTIPILVDESTRVVQQFKINAGGKAVDFSLALHVKIDGRFHKIKHCDANPEDGGVPHCHIYKLNNGEPRREIVGGEGAVLGLFVSEFIRDIRSRLPTILDNYKHSR
jgi:hypothetical protein